MTEELTHSFIPEITAYLKGHTADADFEFRLSDYHESDIAEALGELTVGERKSVYGVLSEQYLSDIFSYIDDIQPYLAEIPAALAARIIGNMDSDDAVDILETMEDEEQKKKIIALMDPDSSEDIKLIQSYEDDEIGSKITTNYIEIKKGLTIRQAMHELVVQAGENDNISTLYVTEENGKFYGSIRLKDLIIAREHDDLETLISLSSPYLLDREKVADCIERIKSYAEDSLPVLNEKHALIGIITAQDVVEVVDDELGEDYAKLAGLTAEEDLKETTFASMRKRLPWLIVLLFLGIGVSSVVGVFEGVVATLPIIICFQSLILDMAGNVGTQSLAVTIRVLMDETVKGSQKVRLVLKEMKVGLCNGLFLGSLSFAFIGMYIWLFKHTPAADAFLISGCVGISLMSAMIISSSVGTVVPLFFHKIKVDPAVASGPLITTVNDLVAVVTYYGLAWILLIEVLHIA